MTEEETRDRLNRLPLGVGANPIDHDIVDACGDTDVWDEIDEMLSAQVGLAAQIGTV